MNTQNWLILVGFKLKNQWRLFSLAEQTQKYSLFNFNKLTVYTVPEYDNYLFQQRQRSLGYNIFYYLLDILARKYLIQIAYLDDVGCNFIIGGLKVKIDFLLFNYYLLRILHDNIYLLLEFCINSTHVQIIIKREIYRKFGIVLS